MESPLGFSSPIKGELLFKNPAQIFSLYFSHAGDEHNESLLGNQQIKKAKWCHYKSANIYLQHLCASFVGGFLALCSFNPFSD